MIRQDRHPLWMTVFLPNQIFMKNFKFVSLFFLMTLYIYGTL